MVEQFTGKLKENDSVIVNCANGAVGLCLVQMLAVLNFRVFAVIRDHEGFAGTKKRLEALGARKISFHKRWWIMEAPTGQRFCVVRPQNQRFDEQANTWD